jgi:hypothetical protein
MIEGPAAGLPALLAACEGTSVGDQIFGVVGALLIAIFWLGITWLIVGLEREPDEWKALSAIYIISAVAGVIVLQSMHGDLGSTIIISVSFAAVIGAVGALFLRRIGFFRAIAAAVVGDLLPPVAVVVVLLVASALGGGCLGEELGLIYGLRWTPV